MGGLSIGVFWGVVVSALGLAALSLSFPLPSERPDDARDPDPIVEVEEPSDAAPAAPTVIIEEGMDADEAADAETGAAAGAPDAAAENPATAEPATGPTPPASPEPEPQPDETGADSGTGASDGDSETPAPASAPEEEAAPATEVPLPSGSEFNRPPPEPEAALPAPDAAPVSAAPQAPVLAGDEIAPRFDTMPASQPSVATQAPSAIRTVPTDARAPASPAASPAPVTPSGPNALTQPGLSQGPQVRTARLPQVETAPEPGPETAPEQVLAPEPAAPAPATEEPASEETPVESAVETGAAEAGSNVPVVEVETPRFPTVADPEAVGTALPGGGAEATSASRLPQIGAIAAPEAGDADAAGAQTPEAETPLPDALDTVEELPAIQRYAADFDAAETRPLMAVVLIDDPETPMDLETLAGFSFPVAFAVDPLAPGAEARAAAFRRAGFEVVILGSVIVDGATATDVEVALAGAQEILPEAVAVIDTPGGRIQGDRPVLDATVAALSRSGHGLVAFPRGLNAAEQTAAREGVPGATVFRYLDDEDQRATVITRFLSRAAFAAAQEGTVIVVGRTRPDTVTALFSWALSGRTEAVALAPLSATLLRSVE